MKKKGVLFQYIRHDIRSGIFGQRGKYIAALIIFLFLCASAYRLVCFVGIRSETLPNPTMGDYLYKLLMGMKVYRPGDKEFEVNVLWMLVNFFLAYIVSFYPFKDLHGYGQLMLIRSQKRDTWWFGKCIWNIGCVTLYYVIIWLVAAVFALCTGGNLSLIPNAEVQNLIGGGGVEGLTVGTMLLHAFLYPWLASLAVSLLQMTVSLLTQPIIGILTVCVVLAISVFTTSVLAPGNYLMLMRYYVPNPWGLGCLWLIAITVLSAVVGYFSFKKRDIFSV